MNTESLFNLVKNPKMLYRRAFPGMIKMGYQNIKFPEDSMFLVTGGVRFIG